MAAEDEIEVALRLELGGLRLSDLRKRAVVEGADSEQLNKALDAENSKAEVVGLIVAATARRAHEAEGEAAAKAKALAQKVADLKAELQPLRASALYKRAAEAGVDQERLDEAIDADDAKGEITKLIVELCTADESSADADAESEVASLVKELDKLKVTELKKRARSVGISEAKLEAAEDGESPVRVAIVELIVAASASAVVPSVSAQERTLRKELDGMKVSELKKRARSMGVPDEALDAAEDGEGPVRDAVVELIVAQSHAKASAASAKEQALRSELSGLKMSVLKKRALSCSVDEQSLEGADDTPNPREIITELIVLMGDSQVAKASPPQSQPQQTSRKQAAKPSEEKQAVKPEADRRRPHHQPTRALPSSAPSVVESSAELAGKVTNVWKAATTTARVLNKRHAMLSYAWGKDLEIQKEVIRVRKALTQRGIDCWMDVDGGMKTDIYDSMADGVENAAVVICFMNQQYQVLPHPAPVRSAFPDSLAVAGE